MSALASYTKALIPEPYVVLGLKLRPFSLGHYFLMQRFGCAFASDNPEGRGGVPDLLLAVAICARTYDDFLQFISDGKEFESWLRKWGKAVHRQIKHDKDFNTFEKFALFKRYMNDGFVIPKFWEGDNGGETSGAHWSQGILLALTGELGYTQTEALNMPLAKAFADSFKLLESRGSLTLMSDDEIAAQDAQEAACKGGA